MRPVKEIQNALDEKRAQISSLYSDLHDLTSQLRGRCDHSKTEPYRWEWDSGYGQQTSIVGKRCVYCLFVDLWSRGRFIDPIEE